MREGRRVVGEGRLGERGIPGDSLGMSDVREILERAVARYEREERGSVRVGLTWAMVEDIREALELLRPAPMVQVVDGLPEAAEGIELYCEDSPRRPGYEAVVGDQDNRLVFPLHDGLQLRLHCGRETFANFVAMLAAQAVDDTER